MCSLHLILPSSSPSPLLSLLPLLLSSSPSSLLSSPSSPPSFPSLSSFPLPLLSLSLPLGEQLEAGIQNVIILEADEALVVTAVDEFDDVLPDGGCDQ